MSHRRNRALTAALLGALTTLVEANLANAFEPQLCTYADPSWNAPKGAIVANQSNGPIRAVLQGVNENLTHTIVAQGNGWATHSTSLEPSALGRCDVPINPTELRDGHPGFSQSEVAGMYNFLRGSNFIVFHHWTNNPWEPLHEWIHGYYATWMDRSTDWLWSGMPYQWTQSLDYGLNRLMGNLSDVPTDPGFYKLGYLSNAAFKWMPYNFHQYMTGSNRTFGGDPGWSPVTNSVVENDVGIVCSQVPAYASAKATGNIILSHLYTKQQTTNAGVALWQAVKSDCMNKIGFWKTLLAPPFTGCSKSTICSNAAWQVLNCFFLGKACNNQASSPWNNWVNDPSQTLGARSLSPDVLLGWGNYATSGNGVSPWAAYTPADLRWNQAGRVYRCWY